MNAWISRLSWSGWLLVLVTAVGELHAQEEKEAMPPRRLRVLPVGDDPAFEQEIRDGVRYEKDAALGSLPPLKVEVAGEGVERAELNLQLRQFSEAAVLPGSAVRAMIESAGKVWHQVTAPEGGDFLAVVWRDPKEGTWDKARSLLVRDDASIAAGQIRFVNACPVKIAVKLGGTQFVLGPGATEVRKVGVVEALPITLAYGNPKDQSWNRFYSSALVQNRGERTTLVTYVADQKDPESPPVKWLALRESVPPPLVVKPKGGEPE